MVVSRFILLQLFLENSISIADDPRTFTQHLRDSLSAEQVGGMHVNQQHSVSYLLESAEHSQTFFGNEPAQLVNSLEQ